MSNGDRMGAVEWVERAFRLMSAEGFSAAENEVEARQLLAAYRAAGGARGLCTPQLVWRASESEGRGLVGFAGPLWVFCLDYCDDWELEHEGEVWHFDTLEEAQARAQELLADMLWGEA